MISISYTPRYLWRYTPSRVHNSTLAVLQETKVGEKEPLEDHHENHQVLMIRLLHFCGDIYIIIYVYITLYNII